MRELKHCRPAAPNEVMDLGNDFLRPLKPLSQWFPVRAVYWNPPKSFVKHNAWVSPTQILVLLGMESFLKAPGRFSWAAKMENHHITCKADGKLSQRGGGGVRTRVALTVLEFTGQS